MLSLAATEGGTVIGGGPGGRGLGGSPIAQLTRTMEFFCLLTFTARNPWRKGWGRVTDVPIELAYTRQGVQT